MHIVDANFQDGLSFLDFISLFYNTIKDNIQTFQSLQNNSAARLFYFYHFKSFFFFFIEKPLHIKDHL